MRDTTPAEGALWRPVSPEDYVGADGRCAGAGIQPIAGPEGEAAPQAGAPVTATGIGLGMSECEVIRRAGAADNIDIGNNDRGERAVTLTYRSGNRPGIYRFQAGRLASIERGAEPPPAPRVAKPKPKPAAPKTAAAPRAAPPAAPQGSAPWPAAQPAAQQPQSAPWPAPQGNRPPPAASPWPSSQPAQPQANSPWPAPAR